MRRREAAMWPGLTVAIILALLAFIISFDALRVVGLACGINDRLAWMFPLIIDGSTLAFTWAAWAFKTRRLSTFYPWLMLVLFSIISLIGNALHAHPVAVNGLLLPSWVPPLIMTVPPVALLATTHMIVLAAGRTFDNDDQEWEAEHNQPVNNEPHSTTPIEVDVNENSQTETHEPEPTSTVDIVDNTPADTLDSSTPIPVVSEPESKQSSNESKTDILSENQSDSISSETFSTTPISEPEHDITESNSLHEQTSPTNTLPTSDTFKTESDTIPTTISHMVKPVAARVQPPTVRPSVNPIFLEPQPVDRSLSEQWADHNPTVMNTTVARILGIKDNTLNNQA